LNNMAKQERSKKSTVSNSVDTFRSANQLPEPPVQLSPEERQIFDKVLRSREVGTWSEWDLVVVCDMVRVQLQFDGAMDAIRRDGRTTVNERGTPVANPETAALNQLAGSLRAFAAQLGLSASQRGVAGSKQSGRNQAEQEAREVIKKVANNDLLA
jgi:P27 family predicted phage terminase small subunit